MDNLSDYCRLCADLKEISKLNNMGANFEKCQEIVIKLTRFNIHVDFNNMLPKTVCIECLNSLESAYDFVTTVDLAQEAFEDYESSPLHFKKDEVDSEQDTIDISNKDNSSKSGETSPNNNSDKTSLNDKTEETSPNSKTEANGKIEIEIGAKAELKEENSTGKSKKVVESKRRVAKSKPIALDKTTPNNKQRKKPKISTNVDLDTWYDYNWVCAYCDRYFLTPSELKIHSMQYHFTCNPYRCFDCRARGLHMDNFVTHISRHRPVLTLTCYKCSVKCETLKEMKTHKTTHHETDFVCIGCNTNFFDQVVLDEHMKIFYKNAKAVSSVPITENESLKCVLCKKTSKNRTLLNRHLIIHTERKRVHVCETCGDSFYNRKELVQHVTVHSDSRPYKCEVCKFTFKIKHELKKHAAVHFGPKRFSCEQCGKCFRLCKELVVHSAVHKEARPYECTHCNKSFRFRHLLIQHLRLHTGSKPYSCKNCPLTFRNWSNFNKHTKDVHGVDNSKRKRTSDGLYAVDPDTNEVIYPDMDKVLEWKKKILGEERKGRPKKTKNSRTDKKSEG